MTIRGTPTSTFLGRPVPSSESRLSCDPSGPYPSILPRDHPRGPEPVGLPGPGLRRAFPNGLEEVLRDLLLPAPFSSVR